jgi:hypothetical protein
LRIQNSINHFSQHRKFIFYLIINIMALHLIVFMLIVLAPFDYLLDVK